MTETGSISASTRTPTVDNASVKSPSSPKWMTVALLGAFVAGGILIALGALHVFAPTIGSPGSIVSMSGGGTLILGAITIIISYAIKNHCKNKKHVEKSPPNLAQPETTDKPGSPPPLKVDIKTSPPNDPSQTADPNTTTTTHIPTTNPPPSTLSSVPSEIPKVETKEEEPKEPPTITQITVFYDKVDNHPLFIRGSEAGLNWSSGIALTYIQKQPQGKIDNWVWESTTSFTNAAFKILLDDKAWETGDNHQIKCGDKIEVYPKF